MATPTEPQSTITRSHYHTVYATVLEASQHTPQNRPDPRAVQQMVRSMLFPAGEAPLWVYDLEEETRNTQARIAGANVVEIIEGEGHIVDALEDMMSRNGFGLGGSPAAVGLGGGMWSEDSFTELDANRFLHARERARLRTAARTHEANPVNAPATFPAQPILPLVLHERDSSEMYAAMYGEIRKELALVDLRSELYEESVSQVRAQIEDMRAFFDSKRTFLKRMGRRELEGYRAAKLVEDQMARAATERRREEELQWAGEVVDDRDVEVSSETEFRYGTRDREVYSPRVGATGLDFRVDTDGDEGMEEGHNLAEQGHPGLIAM